MASRAHVIYDYPLQRGLHRGERVPRRDVWYQAEDPVVLPRNSILSSGGGLILAALTAAALLAGSAYSVSYTPPPSMLDTPTTPLVRDYAPAPEPTQANVTNQLSGPALAVPERGTIGGDHPGLVDREVPLFSRESAPPARETPRDHEVVIDDAAPGAQNSFPQPRPPYPNPTITPPEGMAPPDTAPQTPTPALDPNDPYQLP